MSTVSIEPLLHHCRRGNSRHRSASSSKLIKLSYLSAFPKKVEELRGRSFCNFRRPTPLTLRASSADAAVAATFESTKPFFKQTFPLERTELVEGKIYVRLDHGKNDRNWTLTVGCTLPGKWVLHWGVSHVDDDVVSEWEQPPEEMRPPGSIPIKDYAIDTPLTKLSSAVGGDNSQEVKIDFNLDGAIAAINFILKDEETGACYQHRGRDFKVPLVGYLQEEKGNVVGAKKGLGMLPEISNSQEKDSGGESRGTKEQTRSLEGFYEELPIAKEIAVVNSVTVSVRKCPETAKNLLYLETDLLNHVVVHWGVCKDDSKRWEVPAAPHPPETVVFKDKALRTRLQQKEGGNGCWGLFTLEEGPAGFLFVFKLNESTWLKCKGNDFYIPLSSANKLPAVAKDDHSEGDKVDERSEEEIEESSFTEFTNGIINEIRTLVSGISSEKSRKTTSKEAQESILQEIEKLAAEAYSIFRSNVPTFTEETTLESEELTPSVKISSGTGTGFEVLCQGFNWESHKSGRWYMELKSKAAELSSLGFTVIWLPPPTDSVSPEGYMPTDLYNLNSRYGTMDELKETVREFHKVGIKVLGDAVLNHRCAQYQNKNGVWNIFGGRLNWDDRAVVADDPHFQGRGNKSSGDSFHAAPNIDHSQDFVRKDIKEWLCWLRHEIGYDGWRLDFVRGFWGGYVKDYMDASEPYFAVGEYWDSLSYTYGEMDHNQDAHRQRIIDWINATSGAAGAFDVTTKGILHAALERCEYWRLSDQKGKPPGVVGWWPSRAVTFIENHDTGSTQGHWRFPRDKEIQGYAYTLTHPGTPAVFYDHIFSHYRSEIAGLISLRNRNKINCRSIVKITKAERDVYAAIIDKKVAMKIGPGHYEPPNGDQKWSKSLEGRDYKVWELAA
uniref:alpha-amylase 3, chloroplastic isoform X2 n=1 Tax=Fragaria vesca subsp. vesca TaxID=101020 RepID=UPI0005C9EE24|nr:PREDICTED: alpha-amylase 3, chloroplastic isoform X2 [Fragaria vesca subsp. vesca]